MTSPHPIGRAVNRRVTGSSPVRGVAKFLQKGQMQGGRPVRRPLFVPDFVPASALDDVVRLEDLGLAGHLDPDVAHDRADLLEVSLETLR